MDEVTLESVKKELLVEYDNRFCKEKNLDPKSFEGIIIIAYKK